MQDKANATGRMVRTSTPGIFKKDNRYVVVFRDPTGRQRKRSSRTFAEARELKAVLTADVRRGEFRERSRLTFDQYGPEWIAGYAGRTVLGFRENTRAEYLRDLGFDTNGHAVDRAAKFFGRMALAEIDPRMVKSYLVSLGKQGLSPAAIRRLLAPLRAMLATAVEDGLIRYNPAAGVRVPGSRQTEPEQLRKNLTPDEYGRLLANTPDQWRLFVEFILQSGFRISEVLGLEWGDVDFGLQRVTVARRLYKGIDEPKSRFGRRSIRLTFAMTKRLSEARQASGFAAASDPIFSSATGTRLNYSNTYNRVLKPAMLAAGIEYGGFHRLRHTSGTELRRSGATIEQVQLALGHHDPAFTARVYVHLDSTDMPDPAALDQFGREASAPSPTPFTVAGAERATGGQPDAPSRAEPKVAQVGSLGRQG